MWTLKWSIVKSGSLFSIITNKSFLRLHEKLEIINFEDEDHLSRKRSELISKCKHAKLSCRLYIMHMHIYIYIYIYI